jgi:hypothetical protein
MEERAFELELYSNLPVVSNSPRADSLGHENHLDMIYDYAQNSFSFKHSHNEILTWEPYWLLNIQPPTSLTRKMNESRHVLYGHYDDAVIQNWPTRG